MQDWSIIREQLNLIGIPWNDVCKQCNPGKNENESITVEKNVLIELYKRRNEIAHQNDRCHADAGDDILSGAHRHANRVVDMPVTEQIGGVLVMLHRAWGFGSDAISAPQATLMKVIVEGIMDGGLPWGFIGIGAAIAVVLAILRVPVMPVAIGIYLPVGLSVTMFAGGLLRWAVSRRQGEGAASVEGVGTLFSAGLVAGEGLCGIILAILALS